MKKPAQEAWGFLAFNCPVTDTGHHTATAEEITRIDRSGIVVFKCPVCSEEHYVDLKKGASGG